MAKAKRSSDTSTIRGWNKFYWLFDREPDVPEERLWCAVIIDSLLRATKRPLNITYKDKNGDIIGTQEIMFKDEESYEFLLSEQCLDLCKLIGGKWSGIKKYITSDYEVLLKLPEHLRIKPINQVIIYDGKKELRLISQTAFINGFMPFYDYLKNLKNMLTKNNPICYNAIITK